jgi:hypothetical protein
MNKFRILCIALLIALFAMPLSGADPPKPATEPKPSEHKMPTDKIGSLAYCIQLLQPKHSPESARIIATAIVNECKAKGLDPDLITAQAYVESEFNIFATSPKDAVGLLQVRYITWKLEPELKSNGVDARHKLYWVELNVKCATDIFKRYYDESGQKIGPTLYRYLTGDPKLPKRPWEVEYINKILYYTYKIKEAQLMGEHLSADEDEIPVVLSKPAVIGTGGTGKSEASNGKRQ